MMWLIIYVLLMFAGCLWHAGNHSDCVGYYVCDRKARTPAVAFSILASCIGGTSAIAMTGLAWECGTPAFWWLGSGAIGLSLLAALLARKIRSTNALTLPGVIVHYLGERCKNVAAFITLAASIAVIAAQLNALGLVIAPLSGNSVPVATCLGALFLTAYTFIGGQQAVIRSDIWQFVFMALALLLVLYFLLNLPDCMNALESIRLEFSNSSLPPGRIGYFVLIFGSSFLIGPMVFGRLLSATTPEVAQKASAWAALGMALMAVLVTSIGIALQGLPLAPPAREDALFLGISAALPPWAQVCVTLGMASAIISSADSCLMTASTVCASGLLQHGNVPFTRLCMCLIAALALLFSLAGNGILALLLAASDIYVCGVAPVLFVAIISGQSSLKLRWLYMAGMLCGSGMGLIAALSGQTSFSFAGFGCALLAACVAASLEHVTDRRQASSKPGPSS